MKKFFLYNKRSGSVTMSYQEILYKNENQYNELEEIMFGKIVEAFQKNSKLDVLTIICQAGISLSDKERSFWALHSYLINHSSCEMQLFFELLEQFGFNFKKGLCSYIRTLASYTIDTVPDYVYEALLRVPIVDEIECQKGRITVYSDKLGKYDFTPIKKYFEASHKISTFLKFEPYENNCHNASWNLMEHLKSGTLQTLLMPRYFGKGTGYHTVIEETGGNIIDVAHASVFDLDTFSRLMEGTIVCETEKDEMYVKLAEINEETKYANALVLALHKQSKL